MPALCEFKQDDIVNQLVAVARFTLYFLSRTNGLFLRQTTPSKKVVDKILERGISFVSFWRRTSSFIYESNEIGKP
jgi:hypothetical protein